MQENSFECALLKYGIPLPSCPVKTVGFTRWGKNNCYWAKQIAPNIIVFGDFNQGISETCFESNSNSTLTSLKITQQKQAIQKAQEEAEIESLNYKMRISVLALEQWNKCINTDVQEHPYLKRKLVQPFGSRLDNDLLVIPLYDISGKLWSLQTIDSEGKKRFLAGGRKKACFYSIGSLGKAEKIFICEGFATGASIYMAAGATTLVAFDAGNLEPVTATVRSVYPNIPIVICADNDQWKEYNTGKEKAEQVAKKYHCRVALPVFSEESLLLPEKQVIKPTDFNDQHVLLGLEEVNKQLNQAYEIQETLEETIIRLASLNPLEYEKVREKEAIRLNIRKPVLDEVVTAKRHQQQAKPKKDFSFPEDEVWPESVEINKILNELCCLLKRYAILPEQVEVAVALWIVFTWCIEKVGVAPILAICSPEKQCGKTTVLSLIQRLVYRPLTASNITSASLFRAIEENRPTLLIDEADTFIKENLELRGILNSGHTPSTAFVLRTVGKEHDLRRFSTWGAKAIALNGKLPETLHDRSIVIELRRRLKEEKLEKLRHTDPQIFNILCQQLKRFVMDQGDLLKETAVTLPEDISDRAADNWEPLMAIAILAGPEWVHKTLKAIHLLSPHANDAKSIGTELLVDIKQVLESKNCDRISTSDLIKALCENEEKIWATYNKGQPINPRQMSKILQEYKINSHPIRLSDGKILRGFEYQQFIDVFTRYLPEKTVTPLQPSQEANYNVIETIRVPSPIRSTVMLNSADSIGCNSVTDKNLQVEVEI